MIQYPAAVEEKLIAIYHDMIWLGHRPHVTPRQARAWYSQVLANTLSRKVRYFSGMVSKRTLEDIHGRLVLEHFHRLSFELSELLERHVAENISQPTEFVDLIKRCEQVHITTDEENHLAKQAKGDYTKAGIELVEWQILSPEQQEVLWTRKLKGQVCNAADFR